MVGMLLLVVIPYQVRSYQTSCQQRDILNWHEMSRNPLSSQVISNKAETEYNTAKKDYEVVIPYQVRSYQTGFACQSIGADYLDVVIPYQVRSYQTVFSDTFL